MKRITTGLIAFLAVTAMLVVAGCAANEGTTPPPPTLPEDSAAGTRLAPGLYDLEDGTAQALGTLEWSDLEGGFWGVVGGTEATGDVGTIVAVIVNAAENDPTYVALAGKTVLVTGTRAEGPSVRMAGPEVMATAIEEISDTVGPAE